MLVRYGRSVLPWLLSHQTCASLPTCCLACLPHALLPADSSNVGPKQWVQLARILDANREQYDAFLIAHGTDTLAYTASALSLMLAGFRVRQRRHAVPAMLRGLSAMSSPGLTHNPSPPLTLCPPPIAPPRSP